MGIGLVKIKKFLVCKMKKILGRVNIALDIIKNTKNWPSIILNYFGLINSRDVVFKFKKEPRIIIEKGYGKYETTGLASIWEIIIRKNYTPKGFEINKGDNIIDIGANIGIFSIWAGKKAKYGKVYSYEPFKPHYNRFCKNIKLNALENISAFNYAVCKKNGKRNLFIDKDSSGMHSLIFNNSNKEERIVECITLKDIFIKNKIKQCDFLKIDCEGAEYEILYNTPKEILKKIMKISLEFDNLDDKKNNCKYLKIFLEKNNFIVKIIGENQKQGILYAMNNLNKKEVKI